jgi:chromosome segregation ATPase
MTPIDNAVMTEMLDNCLSDIEYLRAERIALREAKAEAKAEAYDLKEELARADELIAELEWKFRRAIARADENADKLVASERQVEDLRAELQRHKEALYISIRETSDLEDQLALYQDNCECAL